MAVVIFFPAIGFSALLGILTSELTGILAFGWVIFAISFVAWFYLRKNILYAMRLKQDALEFDATHKTYTFLSKEIISASVHAFPLNRTLLLIVKVAGNSIPYIFFTGALSTSAGEFNESLQLVRELLGEE